MQRFVALKALGVVIVLGVSAAASTALALNPQPLPPGARHNPPSPRSLTVAATSAQSRVAYSPQWGGFVKPSTSHK